MDLADNAAQRWAALWQVIIPNAERCLLKLTVVLLSAKWQIMPCCVLLRPAMLASSCAIN